MCSILDLFGIIVTILSNLTVASLPSVDIGDLNGSGGILEILAAGALVVRLVAVFGAGSAAFGNRSQMILADVTGFRYENDQANGTNLILIFSCGSTGSMGLNSVVLGAILTLVSVTGFLLGIAPLGGVELVVAHFGAYPRDRADFCTECAVVVVFLCVLTVSACACYEVCVICDLFGEAVSTKGGTGPACSSDLVTVSAIVVILLGTLTVGAGTCYEVRCIFKFFTEAVLASLGAGIELVGSVRIVLGICTANGASIPVNIVFGALGSCGL